MHLFTVIYNVQHWGILLHVKLNYLSYIWDTQVLTTNDVYCVVTTIDDYSVVTTIDDYSVATTIDDYCCH